jgi:transposase-like protein
MTEKEYYDQVDAEYSYVNELLNQLDSAYDDGYANGYKQAVDEFAKRLKKKYPIMENDLFTVNDVLHREIDKIAEELKRSSYGE